MIYCFLRGFLTGSVTVVGDNYLLRIVAYEPRLFRRDSRSESCNNVLETCLIYGDNVHVSFAEYKPLGIGVFGEVHGKEVIAFVENRRISCIQVFRL